MTSCSHLNGLISIHDDGNEERKNYIDEERDERVQVDA